MQAPSPSVVVLAGPNGAGKTTSSPHLLRGALRVVEYVNADIIAQGLSGFAPQRSALEAGQIMLMRLRKLAGQRMNFAFETTLAARSLAPWLSTLRSQGYRCCLMFLWLPDAETALQRVRERVRNGGHDVPEGTIRRRYRLGLRNFSALYQPLADQWRVYDSSRLAAPLLIASGGAARRERVPNDALWRQFREGTSHAG